MKLYYKGVLCRLCTYREMGEDIPALYYIDAPNQQTMLDAGFNEVHYGLWLKTLTDEEFEKIKEVIEEHYK